MEWKGHLEEQMLIRSAHPDTKPENHISSQGSSPLYDSLKAAEFLGVSKETLSIWRCTKRYNIPYFKVGRLVKYREADLLAFLEARRVS
jgi:excisionase family DNA binding protein